MTLIKSNQYNDAPSESEIPIEAVYCNEKTVEPPLVTSITDEKFDALANRLARQSPETWKALAG